MSSYNRVIMLGNLTRDPELRYTPQNIAACSFGLATNHKYKADSGVKEEVCYIDVIVFGKYAEICHKYITKGQSILAEGRLRQRRWEDKETGKPRNKHELLATTITFMPKKDVHQQDSQDIPVEEGDIPF